MPRRISFEEVLVLLDTYRGKLRLDFWNTGPSFRAFPGQKVKLQFPVDVFDLMPMNAIRLE